MKTRLFSLAVAGMLLGSAVVAVATEYAVPFPIIGISKNANARLRAAAEKLGREFRVSVSKFDSNPVCCVWLEISAWRPNPGTEGYIIVHQGGGTLITASSQAQLDAAVERFIKSAREHDGKIPIGLMTSYEVVR